MSPRVSLALSGLQITSHHRQRPSPFGDDTTTHAQYARGSINLAHWELCDYLRALGNLEKDLSPSLGRSCRFLVVW
jgi:hypothetical protein